MTHFTVLVRFEGDINDTEKALEEILAPYDENKNVPKYKRYLRKDEIERAQEHFKITPMSPSGVAIGDNKLTAAQIKEYFGEGGEDKKGYFYWSTYNPQSKWDWYQVGGRWEGGLTLKAGANGRSGTRSLMDMENKGKPLGIDAAYLKDVDLEAMRKESEKSAYENWDAMLEETEVGAMPNFWMYDVKDDDTMESYVKRHTGFSTHAVVDENGWHEPSKMGYWGITYAHKENEETWQEKFAERFLSNTTDKTVIVMVDAHI
jgi:hypothetical protein